MHKKLYKAKKNWVIGLVAGTILFVGGAATVSADSVNTAQQTITVPTYSHNDVDYNDSVTKANDTNKDAYNYVKQETPTIQVTTWGEKGTYNSINPSDKDLNATTFQQIPEVKTDMTLTIPDNSLQYRLDYQGNNKNYQSIGALSNKRGDRSDEYSRNDFTYHQVNSSWNDDIADENKIDNTHTYLLTYTGDKRSIDITPAANDNKFDQKEFNRVRSLSIKNGMAKYTAPKVTFDKDGFTSFIQTGWGGHGAAHYSVDNTSNLQGFTFKDGQQLPLTYFLSNVDDTAKYLRGIGYRFKENNYRIDSKNGLPASGGEYVNGNTSYYLTGDGLYVLIPNGSGIANWNWPAAVKLPMNLIKNEFVSMFNGVNSTAAQKAKDEAAKKAAEEAAQKAKDEAAATVSQQEHHSSDVVNKVQSENVTTTNKQVVSDGSEEQLVVTNAPKTVSDQSVHSEQTAITKEVTVNNSTNEAVNTANVTVNNNSQSTETNSATLPQTGNGSSIVATALGVALAMFGLGLGRNKKREY